MVQASDSISSWDTGVPIDTLKFVGAKSVEVPSDFVSMLQHSFICIKSILILYKYILHIITAVLTLILIYEFAPLCYINCCVWVGQSLVSSIDLA